MSQMDQQPTSTHVMFFSQNGLSKGVTQHRQYSTSGGHRNQVNFVMESCVCALLHNDICGSIHFHTLDSRVHVSSSL